MCFQADERTELMDTEEGVPAWTLESATTAVVSFPVDIVLFFSVQQSNIRFTSQPASVVDFRGSECLLKLPRCQLTCTSRKATDLFCPNNTPPKIVSRRPSNLNLKVKR